MCREKVTSARVVMLYQSVLSFVFKKERVVGLSAKRKKNVFSFVVTESRNLFSILSSNFFYPTLITSQMCRRFYYYYLAIPLGLYKIKLIDDLYIDCSCKISNILAICMMFWMSYWEVMKPLRRLHSWCLNGCGIDTFIHNYHDVCAKFDPLPSSFSLKLLLMMKLLFRSL